MTWFERFLFEGLRRKAVLAGVALVLVGSAAMWLARSPRIAPVEPTAVAIDRSPSVVVPVPVSEPRPTPLLRPVPKPALRPASPVEETKQVAIQFVTDDPNVIIYWLVDEKGD